MDLQNFVKECHEEVNLQPEFVIQQYDPKTVSYIKPFCLSDVDNILVGYTYVSITVIYSLKK